MDPEIKVMKLALRMGFDCHVKGTVPGSTCLNKSEFPLGTSGHFYVCTRIKGHTGPHVAHYPSGELCPVDPWL